MIRQCSSCGQQNRVSGKHVARTGKCGKCHAALPPSSEPIDADAALFDDVTRNADVPVLVDFWAPWCGPCRMVAPEVKKVAQSEAGKAAVLKLNTEEHPDVAARFGIRSIPSFYVFKQGDVVAQQVGALNQQGLRQLLERAR
jgi:thioredoxin 2